MDNTWDQGISVGTHATAKWFFLAKMLKILFLSCCLTFFANAFTMNADNDTYRENELEREKRDFFLKYVPRLYAYAEGLLQLTPFSKSSLEAELENIKKIFLNDFITPEKEEDSFPFEEMYPIAWVSEFDTLLFYTILFVKNARFIEVLVKPFWSKLCIFSGVYEVSILNVEYSIHQFLSNPFETIENSDPTCITLYYKEKDLLFNFNHVLRLLLVGLQSSIDIAFHIKSNPAKYPSVPMMDDVVLFLENLELCKFVVEKNQAILFNSFIDFDSLSQIVKMHVNRFVALAFPMFTSTTERVANFLAPRLPMLLSFFRFHRRSDYIKCKELIGFLFSQVRSTKPISPDYIKARIAEIAKGMPRPSIQRLAVTIQSLYLAQFSHSIDAKKFRLSICCMQECLEEMFQFHIHLFPVATQYSHVKTNLLRPLGIGNAIIEDLDTLLSPVLNISRKLPTSDEQMLCGKFVAKAFIILVQQLSSFVKCYPLLGCSMLDASLYRASEVKEDAEELVFFENHLEGLVSSLVSVTQEKLEQSFRLLLKVLENHKKTIADPYEMQNFRQKINSARKLLSYDAMQPIWDIWLAYSSKDEVAFDKWDKFVSYYELYKFLCDGANYAKRYELSARLPSSILVNPYGLPSIISPEESSACIAARRKLERLMNFFDVIFADDFVLLVDIPGGTPPASNDLSLRVHTLELMLGQLS